MRFTTKQIRRLATAATLSVLFLFVGISRLCPMEVADPKDGVAYRSLNRLPLYFIENHRSLDEQVGFYVRGRDKTVFFADDGVTYSLLGKGPETWDLRLRFVGARETRPTGLDMARGTVSFFGAPEAGDGSTSRTFHKIGYKELWPGIDLVYSGEGGDLKYLFLVRPGADPSQIRLAYESADAFVDERHGLVVVTPVGEFRDDKPFVYQETLGVRAEVGATYALDTGSGVVTFALDDYDRNRELIIDPAVSVNASFFGGSGNDEANDIAVDRAGNLYVVGTTTSSQDSFPVEAGPGREYRGGGGCVLNLPCGDAFVAKLDPAGELIYLGYVGGTGADTGSAITVDDEGAAYIVGTTSSSEASFPVRGGPDLTFNRGGRTLFPTDAFVAKIDPTGTSLIYAGYIGGSEGDQGSDIAVDATGNAYIVGNANSPQTSFPVRTGPDLTHNSFTSNNQSTDAFVAKVDPTGELIYAGYIGGVKGDVGHGIAVDDAGAAYVTGTTFSANFPVKAGPDLTFNDAAGAVNGDAFIAKVAPDGTGLAYAGYVGGANTDFGGKVAVDRQGSAYLFGVTASDEKSFPVRVGPDLTFNSGGSCPSAQFGVACTDVFVAKVLPDGRGLSFAGYIGGQENESDARAPFPKGGIAIDSAGHAYVTGATSSDEQSFPVTNGPGLTRSEGTCGSFPFQAPCSEAFIAKVGADGARLVYAGYLGGDGHDRSAGIAVDASGVAYVAGGTTSNPTGFTKSAGPAQSVNGGVDVFVARISSESLATVVNAASFENGPIAPGQIVSIFGSDIGPTEAVHAIVDASGRVATAVGGAEVRFNGVPAPLLFGNSGQFNVQVPYFVEGLSDALVEIVRDGAQRATVTVPVASTAPGLFTVENGGGQVVAVHADGGLNSAANPAGLGEVVTLYATGEGATTPRGRAGQFAEAPLPRPVASVGLTLAGQPAGILYAGAAPGYVGLTQINARIPESITPGSALPVLLQVGAAQSQANVSLAVGR